MSKNQARLGMQTCEMHVNQVAEKPTVYAKASYAGCKTLPNTRHALQGGWVGSNGQRQLQMMQLTNVTTDGCKASSLTLHILRQLEETAASRLLHSVTLHLNFTPYAASFLPHSYNNDGYAAKLPLSCQRIEPKTEKVVGSYINPLMACQYSYVKLQSTFSVNCLNQM